MTLHRIIRAEIAGDSTLRLWFDDGTAGAVDLGPLVVAGGLFAPLSDPRTLRQFRIGASGRWIEWPTGADLCADALWSQVRQQGDLAA